MLIQLYKRYILFSLEIFQFVFSYFTYFIFKLFYYYVYILLYLVISTE